MKTEIKEDRLQVSIVDLLRAISEDSKVELINQFSCDSAVIRNVADQIIYGCTEGGWHGSKGSTSDKPSTALDIAIREVSKKSSEVAKREIESLERAVKREKERANDAWDEFRKLREELHL